MKKWKWIHKWFSLVTSFLLILWAFSGIILNHRQLLSEVDINRSLLPKNYQLKNWNLSSLKSSCTLSEDSILLYGNIGIKLSDKYLTHFTPFVNGLEKGIDNRKVYKIYKTQSGRILAAIQTGLYVFDPSINEWEKVFSEENDARMIDIAEHNGYIIALSRSHVYRINEKNGLFQINKVFLPASINDRGTISLFRTLWVIHSGEIIGFTGQLFVDFMALAIIFLSLTGFIYFFFPKWMKHRKSQQKNIIRLASINKFTIKWHNHIGIWIGIFLIFTTLTGMFLRPPLLITIAKSMVGKIPYTILSDPNTWNDRLRVIQWDKISNQWIIGTSDGFYELDEIFARPAIPFSIQPPLSVMGINVFENDSEGNYLVGSFNGLFIWNPNSNSVTDYFTAKSVDFTNISGSPIGNNMIAGMATINNQKIIIDYNKGAIGNFIPMPEKVAETPISLWNVALEIHTARIFESIIGILYILIIPLLGLATLLILISGAVVWFRKRKKK